MRDFPELGYFSFQVRYYRLSHCWYQRELADRSGINKGSIRKHETGERNPAMVSVLMLAEALEVPLLYLLARPTDSQRARLPDLEAALTARLGREQSGARQVTRGTRSAVNGTS